MSQIDRITSSYLHALQSVYCDIGDRGIRVDAVRIEQNKLKVQALINQQLSIASNQWGCSVFVGADNAPLRDSLNFKDSVNLNATQGERALLAKLKNLGYNVPKITFKNEEGEYGQRFSTGELALQKMLAENQFNYPGGDPAIRAILKVRELGKILSDYLSSRLRSSGTDYLFFSSYNTAGTLTGRRTSRKHTYGFGNNAQNFPKHSEVASYFRECLIPRRGNIFLFVDQIQAEEWPVSVLSYNTEALRELETNKLADWSKHVDRHSNLASKVFGEYIPWKTSKDWDKKYEMKRYLGKKIKHARNYGMKESRMSDSLAQEGFSITPAMCRVLLDKARNVDPSVDLVFHEYVKKELSDNHFLSTPFGRERQFLACRPNADNNSVFNKAYSYIPQSVVGDNTGFAVFALATSYSQKENYIIQEGHDSIVQDVPNSIESILLSLGRVVQAFKRRIKFANGLEIEIPIEASIGYDFNEEVVLFSFDESGVRRALDILNEKQAKKQEEQLLVV